MSAKDPATEERAFSQEDVDRIVQDRLARDRRDRAQVTHEPRVYALESPHSFFADVVTSRLDDAQMRSGGARERLNRYARELAHEAVNGTVEGRRAERIISEADRHQHDHERRSQHTLREFRALSTGGGTTAAAASSASVFVTPIFITDAWAAFRGGWRTFADQCHTLPLSPFGMEAYVPAFGSAAGASQQTEGSGVTETDPSTQLQNAPVVTISGQITLSQQLHDRGYAGGGSMDAVIGRQIAQQLEQQVDVYVLNQVLGGIPGAGVILDNTAPASWNMKNLYQDLALAREQITDTAGVRLRPTHIFSTSDLFSYVTRQVDSSNRPIVTPQQAPGMPLRVGADDGLNGASANLPKWSRFTGLIWPGDLLWFTDDNIPASGADTQIIVSAPDEAVLLMESPDPILSVWPQTFGGNLQVVINLRKYVVAVNRHNSGSATISGAAYATATSI